MLLQSEIGTIRPKRSGRSYPPPTGSVPASKRGGYASAAISGSGFPFCEANCLRMRAAANSNKRPRCGLAPGLSIFQHGSWKTTDRASMYGPKLRCARLQIGKISLSAIYFVAIEKLLFQIFLDSARTTSRATTRPFISVDMIWKNNGDGWLFAIVHHLHGPTLQTGFKFRKRPVAHHADGQVKRLCVSRG